MFPSAKTRENWTWFMRQVVIVLVISAFVYGLVMGCFLLYELVLSEAPSHTGKVPFKDVLITVLAIAGVFVSAFGVGAYALLSQRIQKDIEKRTERSRKVSEVELSINSGLIYFDIYQISESVETSLRRSNLNSAIAYTKQAYNDIVANLDEKEREIERLMIIIKNNWSYYIYESDKTIEPVTEAEKRLALSFAEDISARSTKFTELTSELLETTKAVTGRFSPVTAFRD